MSNIENNLKYRRSKKGILNTLYWHHVSRCIAKNKELPTYTKSELRDWLFSHPDFKILYKNWIDSGYDKNKSLSINRKNNSLSYSLDNIELITWGEHTKKTTESMILGDIISGHPHIAVIGENKLNGEIIEFISISDAARSLNISKVHISSCCNNKDRKSAGGFIWRFKV